MNRALVVVNDNEEAQELGKKAGKLAMGVDAELHAVRFVDRSEYQDRLKHAAEDSRKVESIKEATAFARELAKEFASDAFGELNVDVQAEGVVNDMPNAVVEYAKEHACDHIFLVGRKRSPTGKALFGDLAQSVILNFDGPVTIRAH